MQNNNGRLVLMATPIGNLDDMTFRAVKVLKEATLVAAEDTRRAQKLLNHFEIKVPLTSYHMHNEHKKTGGLLDKVEDGEYLVVLSDAGTPCISDPGFLIVREAVERGITIEQAPGVSALTFAAVACGFPVDVFVFAGFLPQKSGKRVRKLQELKEAGMTAFLYESPFKMPKLLDQIIEVFGPDVPLAIIREATKLYEETVRGTAGEINELYKSRSWKGEIVVAIDIRNADFD